MKKSKTIISLMCTCILLFSCRNNVSGGPNSENLAEIKIGTQTWATKNFDVSVFRNGDTIPEAKTNEEWIKAGEEGKPAWCYYNNDPENGKKYGKLYNWYTVNDPRGLAPKGWHVPIDSEWTTLINYLGGDSVAGIKMKSTSGWNDYNGATGNGTNTSGFAGSPGGYLDPNGRFNSIGIAGVWWSSSEGTPDYAWSCALYYDNGPASRGLDSKFHGYSVRVLRD